jgi:hypothetical protein
MDHFQSFYRRFHDYNLIDAPQIIICPGKIHRGLICLTISLHMQNFMDYSLCPDRLVKGVDESRWRVTPNYHKYCHNKFLPLISLFSSSESLGSDVFQSVSHLGSLLTRVSQSSDEKQHDLNYPSTFVIVNNSFIYQKLQTLEMIQFILAGGTNRPQVGNLLQTLL